MYRLGDQFLPAAALAADQRRRFYLGDAVDLAHQALHSRCLTDDRCSVRRNLGMGRTPPHESTPIRVAQRRYESRPIDRHRQVVKHALEDQVAAFRDLQARSLEAADPFDIRTRAQEVIDLGA